MITIHIPNNFIPERTYIIDVFFGEFLGLQYKIFHDDVRDYKISLENRKEIIVRDIFFSNLKDEHGYLAKQNIPLNVKFFKNKFICENDIPAIYGCDEIKISENRVVCGIDVFASSFFMLSRWEEYVNKKRDSHNRFTVDDSLAFKNRFLDRPIVNEYVEMLWNILLFLGCELKRKDRKFEFILTHDVDWIKYFKTLNFFLRLAARDLIKRRSLKLSLNKLVLYYDIKQNRKKDPVDTFDWLMDRSEAMGIKSHFYFMGGDLINDEYNYRIDEPKSRKIITKIKQRKHIIGFHPGYSTCDNRVLWKKEKDLLEQVAECEIKEGRQHFLRFNVPETWQIWEDNGMMLDSTLCYPEKEGFRCGTCYEFSTFNILTRKPLRLKESPLIIMDTSFIAYQDVEPGDVLKKTRILINRIKRYNGNFVLLWHNSTFNPDNPKEYQDIYENILEEVKKPVIGEQ